MKLFTEEQMRKSYEGLLQNVGTSVKQSDLPNADEYINSLSAIELPTDEEIEIAALPYLQDLPFMSGAKWVIEQIKTPFYIDEHGLPIHKISPK